MKNKDVKILCKKCAGVIDGDITDSETGEFPCYCEKDIQIKKGKKIKVDNHLYWRKSDSNIYQQN